MENMLTQIWEDLVVDFLEVACLLRKDEQNILLEKLREHIVSAYEISSYPSLALSETVIVICEDPSVKECWIYSPKRKETKVFRVAC